jgi:alanyl-tRNA synthetase
MAGESETGRLFWEDPLLEQFDAVVLTCEKKKDEGCRVVLDRTAFYPEGGGQPADEGAIGEAEVVDVQEEEGGIVHFTDRAVVIGQVVECSIDWGRRWDHMQQHTGQHLLSRVVLDEFGAETKGFHLGSEDSTIDLTVELDESQLVLAQGKANVLIEADLAVATRIVNRDDPAVQKARRVPPDMDSFRLVEIEGVDAVPCGGTHVPSTARIGGIHVLASGGRKVHGLYRIAFVCGRRIRENLARLDRLASDLSRLLTTGPESFVDRFEDLQEQNKDLLREVADLRTAVAPLRARALLEAAEPVGSARVVLARIDDLPAETLPSIAAALTAEPDVVALLGAELAGAGRLVFARGESIDADMGALLAEAAQIMGGGGGGAPNHAAGGGPEGEALDTALTTSLEQLKNQLQG